MALSTMARPKQWSLSVSYNLSMDQSELSSNVNVKEMGGWQYVMSELSLSSIWYYVPFECSNTMCCASF